jgi:hypothetical protein
MTMWKATDEVDRAGNGCFEDRAGASGSLAWVLDGASAVSDDGPITKAKSDALWMVKHIDRHLMHLADKDLPLAEIVAGAIECTALDAKRDWRSEPEFPPSAALGVVRRTGPTTEFLVLADIAVILRTEFGVFQFIDRRVDEHNRAAQDAMKAALVAPTATLADARERARPLLADVRRQAMNQVGGYWVASVEPTAVDHALIGALDGVTELILASDGFMRGVELFGLVESLDDLFDCNFEQFAAQIRAAEDADPDTRKHSRWSKSDDICARKLRWLG